MARIEHRRTLSTAERTRRPARFPATISKLGWGFALVAALKLVVELRPLLEPGALDAPRWTDDAWLILRVVGEASVIALPTALAMGFPGARHRNPWLFRGVLLLALEPLAGAAVRWVQGWIFDRVDAGPELLADPSTPLGLAVALMGVAVAVLGIAGAWSLSDGLDEAGGSPRRVVVRGMAVAGVAVAVVSILPLFTGYRPDLLAAGDLLVLVSIGLSLVDVALWFVIVARLVTGWRAGLVPREAWAIGAAGGLALLVARIGATVLTVLSAQGVPGDGGAPLWVISLATLASWILLWASLALGLGRGWPLRRRRYFLGPAAAG